MPIRFRCAYCDQLMGISRRKAGTVVKCPKCAGDIIVPVPEGMEQDTEGSDNPGEVFDNPNFDPQADSPANGSAGATAVNGELPAPMPPPVQPRPVPTPKRMGVFLSLGSLVISVIVVILLLILTFVLGLIIGRQTAPSATAACFVFEPKA